MVQIYQKVNKLASKWSAELFDIAACKCSSDGCSCPSEKKVPKEEVAFLCDQ